MKTKLFFLLLFALLNTQINAQCWQSISTGGYHTAVIKTDGSLWAWGRNTFGQLGDGKTINKYIPTQIDSFTDWQSVYAGDNFTCGIKKDGTLWAWGSNYYGQFGNGTTINQLTPTQIGVETNWKSVSAGGMMHTLAIKENGTLWAWGSNSFGELGDGTFVSKNSPVQIGVSADWKSVSGGSYYTVALKLDGTIWAWGSNNYGQLGDGTIINKNSPIQIGTDVNWQSVSTKGLHTVAIKTDGTLWTWGYNNQGQLLNGTTTEKHVPTQVGANWQFASAGSNFTILLRTDGTLWGGGNNLAGEIGQPSPNVTMVLGIMKINNDTNNQFVYTGGNHTNVIKTDGSLWTWGANNYGQYGDNTATTVKGSLKLISCTSLGIEKTPVNNDSFSIYPNPVNDILHIQSSTNQVIDKIVITELTGKKILEQKGNNKQLNVQQLQQGMYLLQVFSEGKSSQSKFIKQ